MANKETARQKAYKMHIKKHTKKENTYDPECEFCNPKRPDGLMRLRIY